MAKDNRTSRYTIELDIKQGDDVRRTVDDIERSLKSISDSAKSGDLAKGLDDARVQAKSLANQIIDIAKSEKDSTQELEAYSKAATKAMNELEKQSTMITYSLSEQGKEQRARIAEIKEELAVTAKTKEEKARQKDLQKELTKLQKDVYEASDADLKKALEANRTTRANLKMAQQEAKLKTAEIKANKDINKGKKQDLKDGQEALKLQNKFIDALKQTASKYDAIKKAASGALKVGGAVAKGALKVGGAVIGGALALGGAAIASANSQVDREREANRIKGAFSMDDKQRLLGDLYIQTGADYTTIVDAINRVQSVLGGNLKEGDLVQATTAEIRYPGAAAMFRQQNTEAPTSTNFVQYQNRMKAIQGATGASVDQIQASTEKIANMRQSSFSNASMTDLQAVYLGLQGSGAYDTQEELDRAFNSFVRSQKNSKEGVFEHAQKFDWERRAYGATNKQQVKTAISNMDWSGLKTAANEGSTTVQQSEAEKTAQKMRELEELKNKILVKMLEAISPIFEKLNVKELEKIFQAAFDFFDKIAPDLKKAFDKAVDYIVKIFEGLSEIPFFQGETVQGAGMKVENNGDGQVIVQTMSNAQGNGWSNVDFGKLKDDIFSGGVSGHARASGGLTSIPSICGEAGAEMVVPLDPSRETRGRELTQNLNQYFNLSGNESTTLSLSQAVKSRDFTRAMMNNVYLNGRLGR